MNHAKRTLPVLALMILGVLAARPAFASFGITPPYVRNDSLTPGSHYQQLIQLVRGDPNEDLDAKVTVAIPGANDWITVDKGLDFILPKGQQQVPMTVNVSVPGNAKLGEYKGTISVVISPLTGPQAGTVGIALGAQIDVDLNVINQQIVNFNIRAVKLLDMEEGHSLWWLYFPGKVRFQMLIENLGNVAAAPYSVHMDIYDSAGVKLLEQTDSTNRLPKITPFATQTLTAELPTKLPPGNYQARYTIYKAKGVIGQQGELTLAVLPRGTLPNYQGYGPEGLPLRDQIILGLIALLLIAGIIYLVDLLTRVRPRRSGRHLPPPPAPPRR